MKNTIGKSVAVTLFGESHGEYIGAVIDGLAPGIKINREYDNLLQLTEIQLKIIQTVANYVKSGGCLYYSTCSIFKKENDLVIKRFLESSKDFCVEQINSPLNHLKTTYGLQFLPNISSGAGFYICKLRKL